MHCRTSCSYVQWLCFSQYTKGGHFRAACLALQIKYMSCHGWFHLYSLCRLWGTRLKPELQNEKFDWLDSIRLLQTCLFSLGRGWFRETVGKISHVGIISRYFSHFFSKVLWVLFSRGGNFSRRRPNREKHENYPNVSTLTVLVKLSDALSIALRIRFECYNSLSMFSYNALFYIALRHQTIYRTCSGHVVHVYWYWYGYSLRISAYCPIEFVAQRITRKRKDGLGVGLSPNIFPSCNYQLLCVPHNLTKSIEMNSTVAYTCQISCFSSGIVCICLFTKALSTKNGISYNRTVCTSVHINILKSKW